MDGKRASYVYVLFRLNGTPCYVGKGTGDRWLQHERLGEKHPNKGLRRILVNANDVLPKIKLLEHLTNEEATQLEIMFIKAIGRAFHGGPLVNKSDGGGGCGTDPKSESHRQAIGNALRGKPKSESTKQNMKVASAKRWSDPGSKQCLKDYHATMSLKQKATRASKISAATCEAMKNKDIRAKISIALTGRIHDEVRRALTSETVRKAYQEHPEYREKVAATSRGRKPFLGHHHSAETRAKMRYSHMVKNLSLRNTREAEGVG